MKGKISVIVPIFNVSKYLEKSIKSILNQSYSDLEIILVDDGSTDDSGSICDYYATIDKRIMVIHKENGGLVTARKAGLETATGNYIAFVDGDDWIEPEMYSEMLDLCVKNDVDFVESGYTYDRGGVDFNFSLKEDVICLDERKRERIIKEWMFPAEEKSVRSVIWNKLYRASIIKHVYSKVDNSRSFGEDYICYLHLIKYSNKLATTSKIYYHYSFKSNGLLCDTSIGRLRNSCALFCHCCDLIREMYSGIEENKVNAWFARHTVEDFYKINFNMETSMPIYKLENIDKLRNKKVIIYGAGNVGKDVYIQLCKYGDIKIVDWIDKNSDRYHYPYYTVHSASVLPSLEYDVILIAVLREKVANSIKSDIIEYGISEDKVIWEEIGKVTSQFIPEPVGYNIVKVMGGLGNQMFQYAFYRALLEYERDTVINNDSIVGDIRSFELENVFPNVNIAYDENHQYESYKNSLSFHEFYQEPEHSSYDKSVFKKKDCSLLGYWQSEKYFKNIENTIRKDFTFFPEESSLVELALRIQKEENSVSIHIRRGDYLNAPDLYYGICTLDYYKKAVDFIRTKISNPQFYIFSDDIEWTKSNLSILNGEYISGEMFSSYQNWYDMYLMSCCHHNIIANSSFSWWGAWLNPYQGKIVVSPNKWINGEETRDIWCESWVRIE